MSLLDSFEKLMNEPKQLTLTVESGDEAAEIFLLDCTFNRIGIETGRTAEFKVDPGIYSVKVRTGSDFRTKSVVLHADEKLTFEPIRFSTPAPLEGTAKTHEYQVANAANHSRTVHVKIGSGSEIYIFARDWTTGNPSRGSSIVNHNPIAGLSLQDGNGQFLVDLERSAHIDNKDKDRDPWAACNIELNPGNYRLCLETEGGYTLQQTIVASPGWQTQVFLLQRNYGLQGDDLRADLPGASIFMSRVGEGFRPDKPNFNNPDEPDFRLSELARQALMNDRQRLSENILRQTFDRKSVNPMMAIFGAQLMLRNETYDEELIKKVVFHLRDLVRIPHPDIEALAIKANVESSYIFEVPPMLRNSWGYVLDASVKNPGLVPDTSSTWQTAGNLWSEGLWLVWRRPTKPTAADETGNDDVLTEQFKKLWQLEASATDTSNLANDRHWVTKSFLPDDSGRQQAVGKDSGTEMNDAQMLRMVKALGVPRSKVDSMLKDLNISSTIVVQQAGDGGVNVKDSHGNTININNGLSDDTIRVLLNRLDAKDKVIKDLVALLQNKDDGQSKELLVKVKRVASVNEKEKKSLEEQLELLTEKKALFEQRRIINADPGIEFSLKKEIEKIDLEIDRLKDRLSNY